METYIVQAGDTLSRLAVELLGPGSSYQDLMEYNPQIGDPDRIEVGEEIFYPSKSQNPGIAEPGDPQGQAVGQSGFTMPKLNLNYALYAGAALLGVASLAMLMKPKDNVTV